MQEHTVTLYDDEFRLVQRIREMKQDDSMKKKLIEQLVQEIEDFLAAYPLEETYPLGKTNKWLQVGDKTFFQKIQPVKPEKDSPLASQIIVEQRTRLVENSK